MTGGVPNVRDYGADGVDDDTAAIQAAIDASSSGPVYFPPGRYKVGGTLYIRKPSVNLFGHGDHSSRGTRPVEIVYTGKDTLLRLTGATSGFHMAGLFVTGPSRDGGTKAVVIETGDKFGSGYSFNRVGMIQFGTAVIVDNLAANKNRWVGKVSFDNCNLHYDGQALVCDGGAGITNLDVLQSEIRQCLGEQPVIDIKGERIAIVGCNLEGQRKAIRVTDSHAVVVRNCYFEGNVVSWLEAHRVQGLRFVDNYLRQLKGEMYTEPVVLRECLDLVVERPTVHKGKWEIP